MKSHRPTRLLAHLATALVLWCSGVFLPPLAAQPTSAPFRPDRILVKPNPGADLAALHAAQSTTVLSVFDDIENLTVLQLPPGADVSATVAAYQASDLVAYAEPDFIVRALAEPNDFRYYNLDQWSLKNVGQYGGVAGADIHAPSAWDVRTSAASIIVAVIDTGLRLTHEDLAPNLWINPGESGAFLPGIDKSMNGLDDDANGYVDDVHGINAILHNGLPLDDYGHGSHVAGILGAATNNAVGIAGVAWRTQLMACKFIDSQGNGAISDAITCIDYARQKKAKIINASWGGYAFNSQALYDAINRARAAGIVFVAACGNDNNDNNANPLYPASYALDNIIAVAATDRTDHRAWFSNYGATTVDLGAPGSPIFSCWNGSDTDYRYDDGTSMAAPHVAGACALVWAKNPGWNYKQVISRVLSTTDPLPDLAGKTVTGGRLNLARALGATN